MVLSSSDPFAARSTYAAHQVAPVPTPTAVGPSIPSQLSVACARPAFCAATGYGTGILTSSDPTRRGFWKLARLDTDFDAIACPSAALCVAADPNGDIATSTDPRGRAGAWKVVHVDAARFVCGESSSGPRLCQAAIGDVACPSVHLCLAVDDDGNVLISSSPGGGASAWRTRHIAAPSSQGGFGTASEVSCPSRSFCAIVENDAGDILTSTQPAGDSTPWTSTPLHDLGVQAISCASTRLCALTDEDGNVLESTNPAAQHAVWTRQHIDRPATNQSSGLDAIDCPSDDRCVAVDSFGRTFSATPKRKK